jgi:hypothetical protein
MPRLYSVHGFDFDGLMHADEHGFVTSFDIHTHDGKELEYAPPQQAGGSPRIEQFLRMIRRMGGEVVAIA